MPTLQVALAKLAFLLLSLQIAYAAATSSANYQIVPPAAPDSPQRLTVAQIYAQVPILRVIAACESTGSPTGIPRQFTGTGEPLWGIDPKTDKPIMREVGEMQINTWAHADDLKTLGLDVIHSESDNVWYGYLLYKKYGMSPWTASEGCWGKDVDN